MGKNGKTLDFLRWLQLSKRQTPSVLLACLIRNAETVGIESHLLHQHSWYQIFTRWSYCSIYFLASMWTIFLGWIEAFRTAFEYQVSAKGFHDDGTNGSPPFFRFQLKRRFLFE
jgi:hypothetical protein